MKRSLKWITSWVANQALQNLRNWNHSKNLFWSHWYMIQLSSVQSLSRVRLFATPRIAARQASLSITNSRSSLRLTSIQSVMPSSHLILGRPLLLLPPIPPSIRVFSNESTLRMRWPKYWSFSFSLIPSKEIGIIYRKSCKKHNTWRNQTGHWRNQRGHLKIPKNKWQWINDNPKPMWCNKSMLRGKFIAIQEAYLKKWKEHQINNLI